LRFEQASALLGFAKAPVSAALVVPSHREKDARAERHVVRGFANLLG
jgi:hypothetical protein